MTEAYLLAQRALADLKAAIHMTLKNGPREGLRNADVGRLLGIYAGHEGHEGHIPRTLLAFMEKEGVVEQSDKMLWKLSKDPSRFLCAKVGFDFQIIDAVKRSPNTIAN